MEVQEVIKQFEEIANKAGTMQEQIKAVAEIMERQRKMLEILLDVTLAVVDDETAELRIRRRLIFALQQVKGIGMPS